MMIHDVKTRADSFVGFVSQMYYENCDERMAYGQKPYPTADENLEKNREWLENEYKTMKQKT